MSNVQSKFAPSSSPPSSSTNEDGPGPTEIEVYRISPQPGKYYETAEYTRETGTYRVNKRYYTTNELRYVGLFIETLRTGCRDGETVWSIFDCDGEQVRVDYTYEGTTSFVEVEGGSAPLFK